MKLPVAIKNYFKKLSEDLLAVQHTAQNPKFFRDHAEASENVSRVEGVIIYTAPFSGKPANNHESIINTWSLPLVVVCQHQVKDFDGQEVSMEKALDIIFDFISKMIEDRSGFPAFPIIQYFDLNSLTFTEEKNVFDGFSGWRMNLSLMENFTPFYDEDKWKPTTL
jgi:hypothetical protein